MELGQRKQIVHKYLENPALSQRKLAKSLNIARSTVWYVLKQYKETLSTERAPRTSKNTHIGPKYYKESCARYYTEPQLKPSEKGPKTRDDCGNYTESDEK